MKHLRKLRLWIALLLGIVAGLLVLLLPPRPTGTLAVPVPEVEGESPYVQVRDLSADGRYVITRQGNHADKYGWAWDKDETTAVWDRQLTSQTPLISLVGWNTYCLLSPDASRCCIGNGGQISHVESPDGLMTAVTISGLITLFELPSGQKLKDIQTTAENIWFAPDGTLLAVEKLRVFELETNRDVKQLPAKIDGFEYKKILGEFAVYGKGFNPADVRLIAWRTGKVASSARFPQADWVMQTSSDGQVLSWVQPSWNNIGMREPYSSRILDNATGLHRDYDQPMITGSFTRASPDGDVFASLERVRPLPKWLAWLPLRRDGKVMHIERWRTHEELARLPGVMEVCFSADGTKLAAARDDCVVEIYDFPFRTPWLMMAGAAILSAACSLCVGWLWARRRQKRAAE